LRRNRRRTNIDAEHTAKRMSPENITATKHPKDAISGVRNPGESRPQTGNLLASLTRLIEYARRAEGHTWDGRRRVEKFVGVCVIVSGSVHGLVTQEHFQEWWGYGLFFLVAAICLIGFGLALITDAVDPRYMPGNAHHLRRLMYAAGAAGNMSTLVLYVLTRTAGIPLGPGAGSVEPVGAIDMLAKTTELLALAGLALLLLKTRPRSMIHE
jgi:hypothetical protein